MAITINSKFVKFNYVKYRTVEGKDGPQPYVREDIAEILDAIVNYGSIALYMAMTILCLGQMVMQQNICLMIRKF